jgi:hypothetical protein
MPSWSFDITQLAEVTNGMPLEAVATAVIHNLALMTASTYTIDPIKLRRVLHALEKAYKRNKYHSSMHAADVVHAVYILILMVSFSHSFNEHRLQLPLTGSYDAPDRPGCQPDQGLVNARLQHTSLKGGLTKRLIDSKLHRHFALS